MEDINGIYRWRCCDADGEGCKTPRFRESRTRTDPGWDRSSRMKMMELAAKEGKIMDSRNGTGGAVITPTLVTSTAAALPSRGESRRWNTDRNYQKNAGVGQDLSHNGVTIESRVLRVVRTRTCGSRTCKPNSVCRLPGRTVIPLGHALLRGSSDLPGGGDAPSRHVSQANPGPSLFGLAPCAVCPARRITAAAVRSYRTFSPLPQRCRRGGMFSVALSVERA